MFLNLCFPVSQISKIENILHENHEKLPVFYFPQEPKLNYLQINEKRQFI